MVLIIGGMGFIGLNTARRFLEAGEAVVITQHSARRVPAFLESEVGTRVMLARMDVTNPYEVFEVVRRHGVDSIVNLMAPPARSASTQADYHLYTAGLQNVLEAARTFGLRRVLLGSSVAVYGGLPAGPFREDTALPVSSPTQVSAFKKGMEMHAHYYAAQAKLDVVALRIASIYGPLYYSMHNPIGRICQAAVHDAEPDFHDRPGGKLLEDARARRGPRDPDAARGAGALAPDLQHRLGARDLQQGHRAGGPQGRPGRAVRRAHARSLGLGGDEPGDRSLTDQGGRRLPAGAHAPVGNRGVYRVAAV
jgi:UDP-glucose 4-epimerase